MPTIEELTVKLVAQVDDFKREIERASKDADRVFSKMSQLINAETKKLDSSWRLYEATTKNAATSTTFLADKHEYLRGKLALTDREIRNLEQQYEEVVKKKGETSVAALNLASKIDKARISQAELRKEIEKIDTPFKRFVISSKAAAEAASQWGDTLTKYVTLPAIAAGTGLFALVAKAASAADELTTMANQTGLSITRLQELKYVTSQTDAEFDAITRSVAQLAKNLVQGAEGSDRLAKIISDLGIQVYNADGSFRSLDELFPEVLSKLAGMEDITRRNAIAQEIFGRGALDLIPILNAGQAEIDRLTKKAHELGLVMGEDSVKRLAAYNDKLGEVKQRFAMLGLQVAEKTLPLFEEHLIPMLEDKLIPAAIGVIDKLDELADRFDKLDPKVQKALGWGVAAVIATPPIIKNLKEIWGWLVAIGGAAYGAFKTLAQMPTAARNYGLTLSAILATMGTLGIKTYQQYKAYQEQQANAIPSDTIEQMQEILGKQQYWFTAQQAEAWEAQKAAKIKPPVITPPSSYGGGGGGESKTWLDVVREKLSAIGTEIEIVRAKFELLSGSLDPTKDKARLLNEKLAQQYEELKLVEDRITVLSDAYNRMATEKGAMAAQTRELYLELLKEKQAYQDLQKAIEDTQKQMSQLAGGDIQEKTLAMIRARQAELLNTPGGLKGALELQRVLEPSFQVPKFADGGIVWGPTYALVGESGPELITPLDRSGLGNVHITENVYIYGNADRQQVERALDSANMRLVDKLRLARPGVLP